MFGTRKRLEPHEKKYKKLFISHNHRHRTRIYYLENIFYGESQIKYVRKGSFDSKKIEKKILKYLKLYNNPKVSFEICDSIPLEPSRKFKIIKKETINSI